MRSIKLTISDGTPWGSRSFIIDSCEGEPQIRHARAAVATRGGSVEITLGQGPAFEKDLTLTVEPGEPS